MSLGFALIPVGFPELLPRVADRGADVVASGITMGSLSAIALLNLVFNVWGGPNNMVYTVSYPRRASARG